MHLFHGSRFRQAEIMPGFARTGELIQWDKTESNEWLYATTNRDEAIRQGFYSLVSQLLDVKRCYTAGNQLILELYPQHDPDKEALLAHIQVYGMNQWLNSLKVYLYEIEDRREDGWIKNNNEHNNLLTEWKTQATIRDNFKVEEIHIGAWFKTKHTTIELAIPDKKPLFMRW